MRRHHDLHAKLATDMIGVISESIGGDGRLADTGLKIGGNVQFFAEHVQDPTDNAVLCYFH
jgi:hypothetical protein